MKVLDRYRRQERRRSRRAKEKHQRLDIQGLRMVAVLTVFGNHLFGWPRGGFIGVDVFFVISGFLITGNLMRSAEKTGSVSFRSFYWNRIRRIVPAATLVLVLTYGASLLVFLPFRARQVGTDALFAFIFGANWHFAVQGTDYFNVAAQSVSPIQHYWSLSIEEQFYFVWPALIFVISALVVRNGWTHSRRMWLAGWVMAGIVAASLGWAIYETATSPAFAYFNTFARAWELGAGALLATAVGLLARIPAQVRPWLSWLGLTLIGASLVLITDTSSGFPAPWAVLPAAGAALVIAAGVGEEPKYQGFLRNPISTYIGDISYSLYLFHWPVIVIAGSIMKAGSYFYVFVVALSFALSITTYHLIERPFRHASVDKFRTFKRSIRKHIYWPQKTSQHAGVGALTLAAIALVSFSVRPDAYRIPTAPPVTSAANSYDAQQKISLPPLAASLQEEIVHALSASEWPRLDPPMDTILSAGLLPRDVDDCSRDHNPLPDLTLCSWGSGSAPTHVVLVGDSIALNYGGPLRTAAVESGGRIQVTDLAMGSCPFINDLVERKPPEPRCADRKNAAIDYVNKTKPQLVIISNLYQDDRVIGSADIMKPIEWYTSVRKIIDRIRGSSQKIALVSPPAGAADIRKCASEKSSSPADCVGSPSDSWTRKVKPEMDVADSVCAVWLDSRPWFCSRVDGRWLCPSFVDTTPTKWDTVHMAAPYGDKIHSVITESLRQAGVLP